MFATSLKRIDHRLHIFRFNGSVAKKIDMRTHDLAQTEKIRRVAAQKKAVTIIVFFEHIGQIHRGLV